MTTAIERIFDAPANAAPGTLSPAQAIGAPMVPLGIGAIVLGALLNKPAWTNVGAVATLAGTGLIVVSNHRMQAQIEEKKRARGMLAER